MQKKVERYTVTNKSVLKKTKFTKKANQQILILSSVWRLQNKLPSLQNLKFWVGQLDQTCNIPGQTGQQMQISTAGKYISEQFLPFQCQVLGLLLLIQIGYKKDTFQTFLSECISIISHHRRGASAKNSSALFLRN